MRTKTAYRQSNSGSDIPLMISRLIIRNLKSMALRLHRLPICMSR